MEYEPQKLPWKHQQQALKKMKGKTNFALLMAMRTGKTKIIIDDFGVMEKVGEVDDLLVICPAGAYRTWSLAFKEHASLDLIKRARIYVWSADQTSAAHNRALDAFLRRRGPRILLVNIEALSSVARARNLVLEFASQGKCYGVVDESTTIKNVDAERAKFITEKLKPRLMVRRILTGLPTPRSPLDLFGQFLFLDPAILGYDNYVTFERRYADIQKICILPIAKLRGMLAKRVGKRFKLEGIGTVDVADLGRNDVLLELERAGVYVQTIPKLRGYRNEEELAVRIKDYSYRVRLEDCYDMPPKTYAIREVAKTKEQERNYREMLEQCTTELASMTYVTADNVVTRMLKLHQILCGHVIDEDGDEREIPENKTQAVLDLLEEYDGKAVIWVCYDHDIGKVVSALRKAYGPGSVARFWGGNRKTREAESDSFMTDPECRFMVATSAAGKFGRTWTIANLLIYYASTNNLEHRSQSEERASGVDKTDFVNCVDLVVPGTVEVKILEAIREKMNMSDIITGDDWRSWVV